MSRETALMILRTIADAIREGDELTDDDASDLGRIAEWLVGRAGL